MVRITFAMAITMAMTSAQTPPTSGLVPAGRPAQAQTPLPAMNALVLRALRTMPEGGGYAVSNKAQNALKSAITLNPKGGFFSIEAAKAKPSFCSGTTYTVFMKVLLHLETMQQLAITPASRLTLVEIGTADGVGVWGRWNANGPGTAKFFAETGCGTNFTDFSRALPGDFLKIWWTEEIGARESGHSVIYLGTVQTNEGEMLRFWSSNLPGGYGEKQVPMAKVKRALFSRLERPERLANLAALPRTNAFLAAMLKRAASWDEVVRECRVEK